MSETREKLSWFAFRYVANELDATESREFESLLSTDQAAREAVANAVEETTQILRALAGDAVVTAASQRTNWNRKATRVAVVAVGSVLTLLLALGLVISSLPISGHVAHHDDGELPISPAQLAYAWAEARTGSAELQSALGAELADTLDAGLNGPIHVESEASLVAPSWMLAALAQMDGIDSGPGIQE